MRLHDVHCHVQSAEFDSDREAVLARAQAAGVARVLAVAEDLADCHRVLELSARWPLLVRPALGVHPDRAQDVGDEEVEAVIALARAEAPRLAALGEVGLDYRPCWDEAARSRQREVLLAFVALSLELALPLSVHSRSAGHHAVTLLAEAGAKGACLHAFDGRAVHGLRGASLGYGFSIPPSVVRSPVKQALAERLPASALLLESDSPVLGPSAGARNEPANVRGGLAVIARLRGEDEVSFAATLDANARRLLPRLFEPTAGA